MLTQNLDQQATTRSNRTKPQLGIGWRPELALAIARRKDLGFVEIVAENWSVPQRRNRC